MAYIKLTFESQIVKVLTSGYSFIQQQRPYGENEVYMKNYVYKLSLYSVVLVIVVILYSILLNSCKPFLSELIYTDFLAFLYWSALHNLIPSLLPSIFAIGYALVVFLVLKYDSRQLIITVINAMILIVVSLIMGGVVLWYTSWFNSMILTTFTKTMTIIGLLIIILSFTFKMFKNKSGNNKDVPKTK